MYNSYLPLCPKLRETHHPIITVAFSKSSIFIPPSRSKCSCPRSDYPRTENYKVKCQNHSLPKILEEGKRREELCCMYRHTYNKLYHGHCTPVSRCSRTCSFYLPKSLLRFFFPFFFFFFVFFFSFFLSLYFLFYFFLLYITLVLCESDLK